MTGIAQGSGLGSLIWNDGVLRLRLPNDTTIVGFADDIVIGDYSSDSENVKGNRCENERSNSKCWSMAG